jgi:hypothetical protein
MSLRSAGFLQKMDSRVLQFNALLGWRQISAGLRLVAFGYCALLLGSAVSAVLIWSALSDQPLFGLNTGRDDRNLLPLFLGASLLLTALFSYGLVIAGQWRCLMYAPQRSNAKELIYICFHCLIVGSVLNGIGAYLDGVANYKALQHGWTGLQEIDAWSAGNLMQVGSILLGIAGSLVFSQFLRNVADCFKDRRRARAVDLNLWFMGLLVGGSVGAVICMRQLALRANALPWLAAGWLLCFGWHLWLVLRVRRCVDEGLRHITAEERAIPIPVDGVGAVLTHTLSGLHRLARNARA